ncbi:hydrogenase expression/formation C-terminal domain-containing protein [Verrucomicrobium sp. 3C]|uniref:hydrogenase expression/formation C-terminal domain-containing protein n=1 Tax=Verrucomicrobium sp. 3C TaxID=1134055 RepID=UPI0003696E94|nr:hydrogenase expression/formation C-terminal domain-containing protein [Verrucomicrobium sp. 3C]
MHSSRKSPLADAAAGEKDYSPFPPEKLLKPKQRALPSARGESYFQYAPRIEGVLLTLERALLGHQLWEPPRSIPLTDLNPDEQELLLGILGEGTAIVEVPGKTEQSAVGTMLSGVWFVEGQTGEDHFTHAVDVGVLPSFAVDRLADLPSMRLPPMSLSSESVAVSAVLQELLEKEREWEREAVPQKVHLQLHPLLPLDYERLASFLGPAPLIGWQEGRYRWWLLGTQWRDLWRVEVRTWKGQGVASFLEIGRYPDAFMFPPSAFLVGARRVQRLLQLYGE